MLLHTLYVLQRAVLEEKEQMIGDLQFSLDERTTQLEEVSVFF